MNWDDGKRILQLMLVFGLILALVSVFVIYARGCGVVEDTAAVVTEQFSPRAMLQKYEWFKDTAAQLDKKKADIEIYESRVKGVQTTYGAPQTWPRDVREQLLVWTQETAGVKASYNALAAEYNAQMAKFNWRFANAGEVPAGGQPLPRAYRVYEEK